jgi:gentisate 1,2-dioxygenase
VIYQLFMLEKLNDTDPPLINNMSHVENSTQNTKMNGGMPADKINGLEQLLEALKGLDVSPLWSQMKRLNPPAPNPTTVPFVWDYAKIRPYLEKAGELVTEGQAERRVLMLVNPNRGN